MSMNPFDFGLVFQRVDIKRISESERIRKYSPYIQNLTDIRYVNKFVDAKPAKLDFIGAVSILKSSDVFMI